MQDKPIVYGKIPSGFDETKHYVIQAEPVEKDDHVFIELLIKDLELAISPEPEQVTIEPEPTLEEVVSDLIQVLVDKGVVY